METYEFEPAFIPSTDHGPRGTYLIPATGSSLHDEVRYQTVLAAHPDVEGSSWRAFDGFVAVGLCGPGLPVAPLGRFAYTDADVLILEAERAAQEAAAEGERVFTLEEIEAVKRSRR